MLAASSSTPSSSPRRTPTPVTPAPTCGAPRTSSSSRGSGGWSGTGVAIALPEGYAAFVHPRSGLAARHGITIVNAPGTVDAGYRGEIKVCLLNTDREQPGHGSPAATGSPSWSSSRSAGPASSRSPSCPTSARGIGGYGSTGGILGNFVAADRSIEI